MILVSDAGSIRASGLPAASIWPLVTSMIVQALAVIGGGGIWARAGSETREAADSNAAALAARDSEAVNFIGEMRGGGASVGQWAGPAARAARHRDVGTGISDPAPDVPGL
ncbi:hypothetical protein GCM10027419_05720 [Pandoraea terrae]